MLKYLLCLLPLAAVNPVGAGQAEICYSSPTPYDASPPPTNSTVFACPHSGLKTLPELATLGFDVVQLTPVSSNASGGAGITHVTAQLVIQKK